MHKPVSLLSTNYFFSFDKNFIYACMWKQIENKIFSVAHGDDDGSTNN